MMWQLLATLNDLCFRDTLSLFEVHYISNYFGILNYKTTKDDSQFFFIKMRGHLSNFN
jgi:hypothetical protein